MLGKSVLAMTSLLAMALIIFVCGIAVADFDSTNPDGKKVKNPPAVVVDGAPPLVGQFPSPDGATRGLAFDGKYLWSADNGDGNSVNGPKIYKLDPNTGAVIASYPHPGVFPNGLAWDGKYLWHSDHGTGLIYKIDPTTWTVVNSFPSPGGFSSFDLAWYEGYLYAVRANTTIISKIDPNTGAEVAQILCLYPGAVRPFGLEALPKGNAGQLWAADDGNDTVNEHDFATAAWVGQWPSSPATYPCGLAYDPVSGYLWASCWETDKIYIFDVGPAVETGTINGHVTDATTGNPIANALIIAIQKPAKVQTKTDGNGYYEIKDLQPGKWAVLCLKKGYKLSINRADVKPGETTTIDFRLTPKAPGSPDNDIPPEYRDFVNAAPSFSSAHKITTTWANIKTR